MITETDYIIDKLDKEAKSLPVRQNQCIQHLIELGYIPMSKVNALQPKDLRIAKTTFIEEAQTSLLFSENELTRKVFEDEDEFLADLLETAVDIDEGFSFDHLPEIGEVNLISRIIHYRLDIFGMWPFAIDSNFSIINSIANIKIIGEYVNCDPVEAVNYLADVELLTKRLLEIHSDEKFIVTFKSRIQPSKDLTNSLDKKGRFKKQLIEDFGERSEFFKYLNKEVLKNNVKKIDFDFLGKESKNPFKRFVLRLIQVHQWQDGLYDGLLDSDIGEVTIQSFLKAIDFYNLANNKNIRDFRVLTYVDEGYFLFNALFFLQEYVVEKESANEVADAETIILGDLSTSVEHSDEKSISLFEANMDLLKAEISMISKQNVHEKKGLLKRIYFGIKKFFKKIIKVSKKIFSWLVNLAKKFKEILKKIFSHFFVKLGKGIKAFLDGIAYILGKKSTITKNDIGLIASVMRMDGDSYCIVSGNSTDIIDSHIKKVKYNVSSMAFALTIVGGVLKIIVNALLLITLPMLFITIVKTFKLISESYKKLDLATT